ncbi:MAG: RNA polymerase sigma factor [bacterium]|nr:RNA polymerase sigma factor [bacterium]
MSVPPPPPLFDADVDTAAIRRVLVGDTQAYAQIVARHEFHLRRLLAGILHDAHLAEDVLQDVWLLAYRRLATFQFRARFRTWLSTIAVRQGIKARGKSRFDAERREPIGVGTEDEPLARGACPFENARDRDEARTLLAGLPPKERASLALASQGWTYEEIAARLESPMGSVATWIHRGRQRLVG